jgi:hypothetical protein
MGIFSALFGKTPKGYESKNIKQYEDTANTRINQRLGQDSNQITGAQGIQTATAGYNFNPQQQAIQGYQSGGPRYNPAQFKFQGLPQQYGRQAYESGVSDIRREGQGQFEKMRESVGTRRPGLLAKMQQNYSRDLGQREGALRRDIGLEEMRQNVDMNRAEQEAQAGENYRGFAANADERFRNLGALEQAGQGMISTQSGLVQNERGYRDQALDYIMKMFGDTAGLKNQSAQLQAQQNAATMSALGSIASAAVPGLGGLFKGKK